MIGEMPDRQMPHVGRFKGKVAIYVADPDVEEDNHGFLLSPQSALSTAVKMLGAVGDMIGDGSYGFDVDGFTGRLVHLPGQEPEARLTISIDGARFTVNLTPTQLAELAVGLEYGSRLADRASGRPEPDR